ncbi:hypothetical protein EPYR_03837 [Erwinia pyrifoliae DSM 12163]|nr:hypothetical protein EPYR_03837 [Erwinia pyrifoliae DSM 12163]
MATAAYCQCLYGVKKYSLDYDFLGEIAKNISR